MTFAFISSISQNISQFLILTSIAMIGMGMYMSSWSTYVSETNSKKYSKILIVFSVIFFLLGSLTTSIYAYFCLSSLKNGNWRLFI